MTLSRRRRLQFLHDYFDQQWRRWPERIAIDVPAGHGRPTRTQLTYADLARQSAEITRRLEPHVIRESIVILMLPRTSAAAYAAQLAVLRTGAAYTCVDPSWPDERLRSIVADSNAAALMTDAAGTQRVGALGIDASRLINLDTPDQGERAAAERPAFPAWLTPATLAYLIYTSGTTGPPKGVMIEHRAIVNLISSDVGEFALSETDRVGHGSSHAYDSSLEEIWLAWAAGGTVVVLDDEAVRSGPDLVSWLARERVSVLCPPPTLLRAMGGAEAAAALPDLKLLYVGGEALPEDVAAIWAVGRRLVNGYGPTECTVTSLRADIRPGEPVTIGGPIAGLDAWVLDDALEEVPQGMEGQLCIGGIGLARGYWNSPETTAATFSRHPRFGRIYLTGDLAHRDRQGRFFYRGRIDAQVKLRGHRIELEEIEAALAQCAGVRTAACRVDTHDARQTLEGFIVPWHPDEPPSPQHIRLTLRRTLPDHMIPGRLHVVASLPMTIGGKLNRRALPFLDIETPPGQLQVIPIVNDTEAIVEAAVRHVLRQPGPVSATDDFFTDLGGDSMRAAELVTGLRQHHETRSITVRDVYEAPTIRGIAGRARPSSGATPTRDRATVSGGRPHVFTAIQAIWIVAELWIASIVSCLVLLDWLPRTLMTVGLIPFLLLAPLLGVLGIAAYGFGAVTVLVLTKRLLIGRYRPTNAPVWGTFHIRNWVVQQTANLVPWGLVAGGEFQCLALRALGARIGRRVHIHRGVDLAQGGWDLLDIGDDVTLGQDAELRLVELDAGRVIVGPIVLGNRVTIETRAGVAEHTRMGDDAYLTAHSSLATGQSVPAGERWDGVPARRAGSAPPAPPVTRPGLDLTPLQYSLALSCARVTLAAVLALPIAIVSAYVAIVQLASASAMVDWLTSPRWQESSLLVTAALVGLAGPITLVWQALVARAMGRVTTGVIQRWSVGYLRVWIKTGLVESAGNWLSGTLLWPAWLRASGMSVGAGCEISTIIDVVPEHTAIGRMCFLADGIYLGGPLIHRGTVTLSRTRLEEGVFLGNHAVIPGGMTIAEGVLVGISTIPDARAGVSGTSWFGHPPFALARRPPEGLDRRVTHEPSAIRYMNRLCWEWLRFAIPIVALTVLVAWVDAAGRATRHYPIQVTAAVIVPALTLAAAAAVCVFVLALKWVLLGRVAPGEHPLWSCWCSRWDFLYVVWTQLAKPLLARFEGTLLLNWYLRAMGATIGRRVVLGPGFAQMVDPDMLEIADDATVHALFQAHTFEDRMLKIDRIRIGRRATVGSGVVLLYGADIGDDASIAGHSVVMKRERLMAGRSYEGCPTREAEH